VANTLGGDKTKTTSDLLQKVLASRVEALREEQISTYVDYYALLSTINYTHTYIYIYIYKNIFLCDFIKFS